MTSVPRLNLENKPLGGTQLDGAKVRVIQSTDELCSLEHEWDRLWLQSDVTVPSARARIISLWVECFAGGADFRAPVVEREGAFAGAMPLVGRRFLSLLPAGSRPCNVWASSGDLLLSPAADPGQVVAELVAGLEALPWHVLVFEQIPFETARWRLFRAALDRAGYFTRVLEQHRVGQVEIAGDWKAYEATRKSRHRQRRRRNARMLESAGETRLAVHGNLADEDVQRLMVRGFEVEQQSWKGQRGTALLQNREVFQYYLREATQLARWGQAELVFLEHNEKPIAFNYGWLAKGVGYCVKVGYDEAYGRYGPGQQLIMRYLERLHADPQCSLFDFHGRLVPWTESWCTRSYPVGRLLVGRRLVDRAVCAAYTNAHSVLKGARRRWRQARSWLTDRSKKKHRTRPAATGVSRS